MYGTNACKDTTEDEGDDKGDYESKEESIMGPNIPGDGRERMLCAAQYLMAAIKSSNQVLEQFAIKI